MAITIPLKSADGKGLAGTLDTPDARRLAEKAGAVTNPVGPVVDVQIKTLNRTFSAYVNGTGEIIRLPSGKNRSVRKRCSGEIKGGTIYFVDVEAWTSPKTDRPMYDDGQLKLDTWYNIPDSMGELRVY